MSRHPVVTDRSLGYVNVHAIYSERQLGGMLESFGPDVVVVNGHHAPTCGWARTMLCGAGSLATVVYLHDAGCARLAADPDLEVDAVAAVSSFLVEQAGRDGMPAARRVPPIVDRSHYRVPTSRERVLFVNPAPVKGVDIVLALARARPDIPFAVARSWRLAPAALAALIAEARELGNVEVRPRTDDPARLYGDARVLLAPSRCPEAWGRVISEAQMSGIPAIASSSGGLPEAVGDGGLLVPEDSPAEAWLDALSAVWDDADAYARLAACAEQQGMNADLSPRSVGDRFEAVLGEARARAAAARRTKAPTAGGAKSWATATHSFRAPE